MTPEDEPDGSSEALASNDTARLKPVLREVDDSRSGRFPSRKPPIHPSGPALPPDATNAIAEPSGGPILQPPANVIKRQIVDVEFIDAQIPRSMFEKHGPSAMSDESTEWPDDLAQVLKKHGYVSWERTFHKSPTGGDEPDYKKARASRRDRFISFYFLTADAPAIVGDLKQLHLLANAAVRPMLAPSNPLTEPFTGNNDQVNPTFHCEDTDCFQNQWYLFRCRIDQAWAIDGGVSGKGVIVADIDWGFSPSHEDLRNRIKFKRNTFKDDDVNPLNDETVSNGEMTEHGTAVLGLAGAEANGLGMVGVAFGSDLWAIQAGDDSTRDHKHWVDAIDLVVDKNAGGRRKVIILEIQTDIGGNIEQSIPINEAIKDAIEKNVAVCVPAGNLGTSAAIADDGTTSIPQTGSILVGATEFHSDSTINKRGISNFGDRVVIYAPGDVDHDVTCCPHESNRAYRNQFGGTSGATAKVAGVVALMLQVNPSLTPMQIRDILRGTGTSVTDDPQAKFIDANAAVLRALSLVH